jgi:hypothetical protein
MTRVNKFEDRQWTTRLYSSSLYVLYHDRKNVLSLIFAVSIYSPCTATNNLSFKTKSFARDTRYLMHKSNIYFDM